MAAFTPKYVLKTKVQIRFSYSREQTYNFVKCKQYDDMKRWMNILKIVDYLKLLSLQLYLNFWYDKPYSSNISNNISNNFIKSNSRTKPTM